ASASSSTARRPTCRASGTTRRTPMLDLEFMRLAFAAGAIVGVLAPTVGFFLVQREMSLIGDGIGHVAFAGVALGYLLNVSPVWTALVAGVGGEGAVGAGLPVPRLDGLVSMLAALTIGVSMRIVGILLIAALMVLPVVAAQRVAWSLRSTIALSIAFGLAAVLIGLTVSYY